MQPEIINGQEDKEGDNYVEDEYVFQGTSLTTSTFKGRVVSWNSAQNILDLIDVSGTLTSGGGGLTGDVSKASRLVLDSIDKSFTHLQRNVC